MRDNCGPQGRNGALGCTIWRGILGKCVVMPAQRTLIESQGYTVESVMRDEIGPGKALKARHAREGSYPKNPCYREGAEVL